MVAAHAAHSSSSGEWIACLDKRYGYLPGSGCGGCRVCVCMYVCAPTPPSPLSIRSALHKEPAGGEQNAWGKPGRRARMRGRNSPGSRGDWQSPQGLLLPAGKMPHVLEEGELRGGERAWGCQPGTGRIGPADPLHPALGRPRLPSRHPSAPAVPPLGWAHRPGPARPRPASARPAGQDESPCPRCGAPGPRLSPAEGQGRAGGGTAGRGARPADLCSEGMCALPNIPANY